LRWNLFSSNNKILGDKGEKIAAKYLRQHGYKLLERNYRNKSGEIDIIAKDKEHMVFVEVKTRTNANAECFSSSINRNKKKRLVKSASWYLENSRINYSAARFDVVFISMQAKRYKVDHLIDAFTLDDV